MEEYQVKVGTIRAFSNGRVQDDRRPVTFTAERLASRMIYAGDDDTRGLTETLYQLEDGRYIVFLEEWSNWQDEASHYQLIEVRAEDLDVGGGFEQVGREAGLARDLTVDDVLTPRDAFD